MTTLRDVKLEYRPCSCPGFIQATVKGSLLTPDNAAEHFEVAEVAALRFRQLIAEGKEPRVHHLGTHVCAVVMNGERFEEA